MLLPIAQVPFMMKVVGVVWILGALFLGVIILIQKGKGGGLGAAFGGAGSSLLGTKTGDVLTWVTITFTVVFLGLAVLMDKFYVPRELESLKAESVAAPAETAQPAAQDDQSAAQQGVAADAQQAQEQTDNEVEQEAEPTQAAEE